jgi:hypothetical protein
MVTVTASGGGSSQALVQVYVEKGKVDAVISGGSNRAVSRGLYVTLDASSSTDVDLDPSQDQNLQFTWTCLTQSFSNFGSSCASLFVGSQTAATVLVGTDSMDFGTRYSFTVMVSTQDGSGRISSATTTLTAVSGPPVMPSIICAPFFSPNTKLKLDSTATGSVAVVLTWSLESSTISLLSGALTPVSATFTAAQVSSSIHFPLAVAAGTFVAGNTYTFRLSVAAPGDSQASGSYSEVTLTCTSPPSSGYLSVSPPEGTALSTLFLFKAPQWSVTNLAQYPLSYEFLYRLTPSGNPLNLASSSELTYFRSSLPQGYESYGFAVDCIVVVSDYFSATSNADYRVYVRPPSHINFTDISANLNSSLSNAFAKGGYDSVVGTVNIVASTVNYVNCSGAPNCIGLNRGVCEDVPHTCGACLPQYKGITGSHNSVCRSNDTYVIPIGGACTERTAADCRYFTCLNNTCVPPSQQCRSQSPDTICSGHGSCYFYNKVTESITEICLLTDTFCVPLCNCTDGYGGEYCQLSPTDLIGISSSRLTMCSAMSQLLTYQDSSAQTLMLQVNSLSQVFDPYVLRNVGVCGNNLLSVAGLSGNGYLSGTSDATPNTLTTAISQFANVKVSSPTSFSVEIQAAIESSVRGLQEGIHRDMVPGQLDVITSSDNIQLKVLYPVVSSLSSASLSPPAISDEMAVSSIGLPVEGLSSCGLLDGYAKLSILQYGVNIISTGMNKSLLANPLLFTSSSSTSSALGSSVSSPAFSDAKYSIVIQFPQALAPDEVPHCTEIVNNVVYDCPCSLLSYTVFNATYVCRDVSNLCPGSTGLRRWKTRRRLDDSQSSSSGDLNEKMYSSIGSSVASETVSTLSTKITVSALLQNIPALVLLGMIMFITVVGVLYFNNWDRFDRNVMIFVNNANNEAKGIPEVGQGDQSSVRLDFFKSLSGGFREIGVNMLRNRKIKSSHGNQLRPGRALKKYLKSTGINSNISAGLSFNTNPSHVSNNTMQYFDRCELKDEENMAGWRDNVSPLESKGSRSFQSLLSIFESFAHEDGRFSPSLSIDQGSNRHRRMQSEFRDDLRAPYEKSSRNATTVNDSNLTKVELPPIRSISELESGVFPISRQSSGSNMNLEGYHDDSSGISIVDGIMFKSTPSDLSVSTDRSENQDHRLQPVFEKDVQIPRLDTYHRSSIVCDSNLYAVDSPPKASIAEFESGSDVIMDQKVDLERHQSVQLQFQPVKDFFNTVMPKNISLKSILLKCRTVLWRNHSWLQAFAYSSLRYSRTIRFMSLMLDLLGVIFVDTMFFKIFFSDDESSCSSLNYTNSTICTAQISGWSGSSVCEWDTSAGECTLIPPPSDITFVMLLAMITLLFSLPLKMISRYLLEEYCAKRPILEVLGLNSRSVVGSTTDPVLQPRESALAAAFSGKFVNNHDRNIEYSYTDLMSVKEEVDKIISNARRIIEDKYRTAVLPWDSRFAQDNNIIRNNIISEILGFNMDGSLAPLSWYAWFRFGTRRRLLEFKIVTARQNEKRIVEQIDGLSENERDVRDRLLLQHFILEQMPSYKRFALKKELFLFHSCSPESIDGRVWLCAWFAVLCMYCFYMYWMLAWAISNGGTTFEAWSIGAGTALTQDVLLNEPVMLFFYHVIASNMMTPQLIQIHNVLNSVALEISKDERTSDGEINFIQYLSGACRAARAHQAVTLPSAALLRHLSDFDLSLCRESRNVSVGFFAGLFLVLLALFSFGTSDFHEGIFCIFWSGLFSSFALVTLLGQRINFDSNNFVHINCNCNRLLCQNLQTQTQAAHPRISC